MYVKVGFSTTQFLKKGENTLQWTCEIKSVDLVSSSLAFPDVMNRNIAQGDSLPDRGVQLKSLLLWIILKHIFSLFFIPVFYIYIYDKLLVIVKQRHKQRKQTLFCCFHMRQAPSRLKKYALFECINEYTEQPSSKLKIQMNISSSFMYTIPELPPCITLG